jgi:hypothetical protein
MISYLLEQWYLRDMKLPHSMSLTTHYIICGNKFQLICTMVQVKKMLKIEPGSSLGLCAQFSRNNYIILTVMMSMFETTISEVALSINSWR